MAALPALRGGVLAVLAALLFGASTPLIQQLGRGVGRFATALLLYAGAAGVGWLSRRSAEREAGIAAADLPRLLVMAVCGALVGPVALAWASSALMLAGVILHLAESHAHEHVHEDLEHEHAHRHDDGHHDHDHQPPVHGEHSHRHRHAPRRHSHPHVPDMHHAHRH